MSEKPTIEEIQRIAIQKGGLCLSPRYINSKTKIKWRCKEGHTWDAIYHSVKKGHWCPHCAGVHKLTIEDMKPIAKNRGGECLSKEYVNNRTKLKWRCSESHKWEATPSDVKQGKWCPICGRKQVADKRKLKIEDLQKIARDRGGECLSTEYINKDDNLRWQCKAGHEWEAAPSNIKRGTWCPICSTGISERICRKIFESIFNSQFPKKRPKWLINVDGNRIELDGFNQELGIAFEYHGRQHYLSEHFFHRSSKSYSQRKRDDEAKRRLCKENEVVLIEIPYHIDREELTKYIIDDIKSKGISIPHLQLEAFDYKKLNGVYDPEKLKEMQRIAKQRGGECLSSNYIDYNTKLQWRCSEGHEWMAVPGHIKQDKWCPYCVGFYQTIDDMYQLAKQRGGECLSKEYIDGNKKLKWKCKEGHEWEAVPGNIKQGAWCPYCGGSMKLTLDEMKHIAQEKGGECLSETYVNANTKLRWKCSEGHEWEAKPSHIKSSESWCPFCAGYVEYTIDDMRKIAQSKGGNCLSTEYYNMDTKLRWQCKAGHEWKTTPYHIKNRNTWCPYCAGRHQTIEDMRKLAKLKSGKCLSKKYITARTKLKWQCKDGHEWEATPVDIKHGGTWCPYCAGKYQTIKDMQKLAQSKGGECLSKKYVTAQTKLKWRCKIGHEWEAVPGSIKSGTWCPYCSHHVKLTIEEMQKIAEDRGGECLSTEYVNIDTKLKWRCKEGHEWESTPDHIKNRGQWCPICARKGRTNKS